MPKRSPTLVSYSQLLSEVHYRVLKIVEFHYILSPLGRSFLPHHLVHEALPAEHQPHPGSLETRGIYE